MRMRLALALLALLPLLQACVTSSGSVWAVDAGYGRRGGPAYWPDPRPGAYPYPGYAAPYGYYPYSRFEPSPFYGTRPVFPWGHPQRCARDRWGRIWC